MNKTQDKQEKILANIIADQFALEEAYGMFNTIVSKEKEPEGINSLGIVCGILQVNEEVELVVRFDDFLEQVTKSEYNNSYFEIDS